MKLEEEAELDLTEGAPLQQFIDLESLDNLFPRHVPADGESPTVTIWYREHEITIHSPDNIEIQE